jgi:plastocyanin
MRMMRSSLIRGVILGLASAIVFAGLSSAAGPTIEASSNLTWSPSTASVTTDELVTFKNPSPATPHGLEWTGGPATPSCPGVPGVGQANWTGTCSFTQAGTYSFVCVVHPLSMKGSVTVTSSGPQAPAVTTGTGTPTGDTAATLGGSVNPHGQSTEYFFNYGTTTGYGETTGNVVAGSGTTSVPASAGLTGLTPGTVYHFQLVAENDSGTTSGLDQTFRTTSPATAATSTAAGITSTAATLQGTVNPGGRETTYFFEYGTGVLYGQKTTSKKTSNGISSVAVSAAVSGLEAKTEYHYRIVIDNSGGKDNGVDKTFTTEETPPLPPPLPPLPPPTDSGTVPRVDPPPTRQTPATGPALGATVKVTPGRHSAPVRVNVEVLAPGAGGKLEVTLATKGGTPKQAGRVVRANVVAGKLSVSVPLNGRAKGLLSQKGKLALKVKVALTPPSGTPASVTRSVILTA